MAEPKKVVYGVETYNDKCKKKAMKAISSLEGIQSIVMNMKDKKLTIVGVNIDPVCGYKKLTKVCNTKILLVEPVKKKVETTSKVEPKVAIVEPYNPFPFPSQVVSRTDEQWSDVLVNKGTLEF
ncbi:hypothetical protein CTI12_AA016430 (mitochondrion) [Artemisia annua]|uniref:HMA domain-containing protein n=1 Tax=Artemisia annua TaxID=35608 RepID=A0A2U1Q9Y5_ARTAN|nr:hypothetical protein CTI12_AA016430 [Artemisia annua]